MAFEISEKTLSKVACPFVVIALSKFMVILLSKTFTQYNLLPLGADCDKTFSIALRTDTWSSTGKDDVEGGNDTVTVSSGFWPVRAR